MCDPCSSCDHSAMTGTPCLYFFFGFFFFNHFVLLCCTAQSVCSSDGPYVALDNLTAYSLYLSAKPQQNANQ